MLSGPFVIALIALLIGTIVAYFVQYVATAVRKNGTWPDMPAWKKRAQASTGSIAALIAGLYVLYDAPAFAGEKLLVKMWLYQTVAAWGGATILDLAVDWFKKGGPK